MGGVAVSFAGPSNLLSPVRKVESGTPGPASVSLTTGDNRADLTFRALQPFAQQIKAAIGKRRIVLKPNNVSIDIPLCATHVDAIEGIL